MARTDPQINLRIPADLKDALDAEAAKNKRSLTAEVVARLEASLGPATAAWAKAFPYAAAAATGDDRVIQAAAEKLAHANEIARVRQAVLDLKTQLVSLDSQAMQAHHELRRLHKEIDDFDRKKDVAATTDLLKQRVELERHLRAIDSQHKQVRLALRDAERLEASLAGRS
ncbi:Arc family DNA-binding protein [Xenophilus sp.]|uniref:Arc family DNA-binding protein n=1 Tax=Xenophilus sp. TaxID=1873499 RepID=UPI0037DCD67E